MKLRAAGLAIAILGCQPSIGDHCLQSTDCSTTGARLCDTSQPNGYCTIFNCQANRCPSGSGCIATNAAALGCDYDDRHAPSRFSRQLCLKVCTHDTDCRETEGYACIAPEQYGLLIYDNDQTERFCLPATTYTAVEGGTPPVCSVGGPTVGDYDAAPGYQGDAGTTADADIDASDAAATDAGTDAASDAAGE